jgi:hypothetical protein
MVQRIRTPDGGPLRESPSRIRPTADVLLDALSVEEAA